MTQPRAVRLLDLGRAAYGDVHRLQKTLHAAVAIATVNSSARAMVGFLVVGISIFLKAMVPKSGLGAAWPAVTRLTTSDCHGLGISLEAAHARSV